MPISPSVAPRLLPALTVLVVAVGPAAVHAQDGGPPDGTLTLDKYMDMQSVSSPEISPDGQEVIYTRGWIDPVEDARRSSVWLMDADGSRARHLVDGSGATWSPDGTRIAYLDEGDPGGNQIWIRWMDDEGATSQVTRLPQSPSNIRWSPDGERLAFTMRIPERNRWPVELPERPEGAEWTEGPKIVEDGVYRRDGRGYVDDGHTHIFVVSADGGAPRQLTEGDWNHSSPEWTADGEALVFSGLREEDAHLQWRHSEIYAVDVESGDIRQLTDRHGQDSSPLPSPDGEHIAYLGTDWHEDTYRNRDIYLMGPDGSNPRPISQDFDRGPRGMMWAPDGSGVYFSASSEGHRNLYFASVDGGVEQVTEGTHMLSTSAISDGGVAVGTLSSFHQPGDVVSYRLPAGGHGGGGPAGGEAPVGAADIERLTTVNDDLLDGVTLGEVEEIWYRSIDEWDIQGWLIKPPDFDPSREYPLMLVIHGGPHAMYNVGFSFGWQNHAANGYLVLYTNPRGSSGYGSEFGNEINNAYPGEDHYDLMAGVDTVVARGYVDTDNKFVYGCSGGGVLTAWVVGHTDRFAAASSNCPVTNWISFVGTTDGLSWYHNFEEFPWDDPSEHLERSPLMYVGDVTTPTMLMTGEHDLRTPMAQTEEYYQALQVLDVPTAMIRFQDEWHGTSRNPSNFMRTQAYLREWFERWGSHPVAEEDEGS